jgi:nucleotide-binding universal stress UspA family protein
MAEPREGREPARRERVRAALDAAAASTPRDVEAGARVESGDPASVLARIARDEKAELIVIGLGDPRSIGRRPGVTAYRTVCASSVPVLAVPGRD